MLSGINPVLRGFHPDPSILRVGDDFYLATSGIPAHLSGWPVRICLAENCMRILAGLRTGGWKISETGKVYKKALSQNTFKLR